MEPNKNEANKNDNGNNGKGPKYFIDIEGTPFPWENDTITTEEIIKLGGLDPNQGIVEIDLKEGTETTLLPNQTITLKPGQGFSKKVKFKRG